MSICRGVRRMDRSAGSRRAPVRLRRYSGTSSTRGVLSHSRNFGGNAVHPAPVTPCAPARSAIAFASLRSGEDEKQGGGLRKPMFSLFPVPSLSARARRASAHLRGIRYPSAPGGLGRDGRTAPRPRECGRPGIAARTRRGSAARRRASRVGQAIREDPGPGTPSRDTPYRPILISKAAARSFCLRRWRVLRGGVSASPPRPFGRHAADGAGGRSAPRLLRTDLYRASLPADPTFARRRGGRAATASSQPVLHPLLQARVAWESCHPSRVAPDRTGLHAFPLPETCGTLPGSGDFSPPLSGDARLAA